MLRRCAALFAVSLCFAGPAYAGPVAAEAKGIDLKARDEETLKSANLGTDAPALIAFFKKRIVADVDRERIKKLIEELGDDSFAVREKANNQLIAVGVAARLQLRDALNSPDVEVMIRAARTLEQIEKEGGTTVVCAAARLLANRNPDGAAEILLSFLPSAEDQSVVDECARALAVVGFRDKKPVPALADALTDKLPLRRGVAAEALCRGSAAERPTVRKMLQDPDATVRLRCALALFDVHEKEAVPVLIALLVDLPRDQVWRAEDALYLVAGDKAPNGSIGSDDAARRDYRKLWDAWWKEAGKDLDLAKLDQTLRHQGYTLLCLLDVNKGAVGKVQELDAEGKVRWQIENLRYPVDAQVLGEDRVLVCEYTGHQVTERNLKGEVQWTKTVNSPILLGARRLPNGNTFIVTRNTLLEVNKEGKDVVTVTRPNDVAAGARLRNGDYAIVTTLGQYIVLNRDGKELKSFQVGQVLGVGSNIEVLPNGRVIVPLYSAGKVVEFDAEGKQLWETAVQAPSSVVRLPNGNMLIASRTLRAVVEIDRNGKEIAKIAVDGMPMKVTRR